MGGGGAKKPINAHHISNIHNTYSKFSKIEIISLCSQITCGLITYQGWNTSSACQNSIQGRP